MEEASPIRSLESFINTDSSNQNLKEYCKQLTEKINLNNKMLLVKGPQLNLNSFEREVAKNRCYYAYPFTGGQYLKATLKNKGLDIDLLDANFEFLKRTINDESFNPLEWTIILDEYFQKNNPSIVGISNLFDVDSSGFIQISNYLKEKRKDKQIVIAGGQKATYSGVGLLKEEVVNFCLQRESEEKIGYLFDILSDGETSKESTEGILFKHKGKIFTTEGQRRFADLKGNLIDEYEDIPIEEYNKVGTLSPFSRMAGKDKSFATVILNRGCHGGCTFCDVTDIAGNKVRSRDVTELLEEISFLYNERGVRHFEFLDDDFTFNKRLVLNLFNQLIKKNMNGISWASTNGMISSTLNYELLEKFKETGCTGFKIGVESGNREILKRIHKPGNLKNFRRFSRLAQQFPEMFISDNYIIGFPQSNDLPPENFSQMMDSFRFSNEMNLDWSYFSIYQQNSSFSDEKKEWADVYEDFVPIKEVFRGHLQTEDVTHKGLDIFKINPDTIPSREQLKEIWLGFNIYRNYILNKNLTSIGNPQKFIKWTKAIQERYPTNPEMGFFLSLAYNLEGDKKEAERQNILVNENLDEYWKKRFTQYGLIEVVNTPPTNATQAEQALNFLRTNVRGKYE
jgi:radical SAM superfamily enzyme YgiQ (UPF0313 family)